MRAQDLNYPSHLGTNRPSVTVTSITSGFATFSSYYSYDSSPLTPRRSVYLRHFRQVKEQAVYSLDNHCSISSSTVQIDLGYYYMKVLDS